MLNIALPLGETSINGEFGGFYLIEIWLRLDNYMKITA